MARDTVVRMPLLSQREMTVELYRWQGHQLEK
jgi:hypothetical protein